MKTILIAGAGKSSISLIEYLLQTAADKGWTIVVADGSGAAAEHKIGGHPSGKALQLDITNADARGAAVAASDLVVSLMPPALHTLLAQDCLRLGRHLITASYVSAEMKAMDEAAREAGLMFMCEMGLDPGIDHMTATEIIHRISNEGGKLTAFKSYCGGLVAPESDDNPWHYKISWNPRNIVLAGRDGAHYLEDETEQRIGYEAMFRDNSCIDVPGLGELAWYANRDSMSYLDTYHVPHAKTFLRATLRYPSFCRGWNAIVALGLTEDNDGYQRPGGSLAGWLRDKTGIATGSDSGKGLRQKLGEIATDEVMGLLEWLGIFEETPLPAGHRSSADILQALLEARWAMRPEDRDMVVMQHEVDYTTTAGSKRTLTSTMIAKGTDSEHTAMAKTVGLPMGILARLLLEGVIVPVPGVHIPTEPAVYQPVLRELEKTGIVFSESLK